MKLEELKTEQNKTQAQQVLDRNGKCPDTFCDGCFFVDLTGSAGNCNPYNAIRVAKEILK